MFLPHGSFILIQICAAMLGNIIKVIGIVIVLAIIYVLLPGGPFWYLWYGEGPAAVPTDGTEDRMLPLLSMVVLVGALGLIFVRLLASVLVDPDAKREPKGAEKGSD